MRIVTVAALYRRPNMCVCLLVSACPEIQAHTHTHTHTHTLPRYSLINNMTYIPLIKSYKNYKNNQIFSTQHYRTVFDET